MKIVKLGGSVITDKSRLRSFRRDACLRLSQELRSGTAGGDLILVHGAGSFGHILASRARLHEGVGRDDEERLRAVSVVHRDVRRLNGLVLDCLSRHRLRGHPVPPYTVASFSSGRVIGFCPEKFERLLGDGLIPVSFGDMVPDRASGFSVCSGDLMMLALARHFRPESVLFVADVDGVFDSDPKMNPGAELLETVTRDDIERISLQDTGGDVTGAMHGKLVMMTEISEHCENCIILNGNAAGRLERALKGERVVCTRVVP